jgi:hypothetical protein
MCTSLTVGWQGDELAGAGRVSLRGSQTACLERLSCTAGVYSWQTLKTWWLPCHGSVMVKDAPKWSENVKLAVTRQSVLQVLFHDRM